MCFQSVQAGGSPDFSSLAQSSLHCLSSAVCACARASEAHLVVGLLVQRDRRVIKGVLDWLPVKDEGIARRGNSAVVAQTHTHSPPRCFRGIRYCLPHSLSESYSAHSQKDVQIWDLLIPHRSTQLMTTDENIKKLKLLAKMSNSW